MPSEFDPGIEGLTSFEQIGSGGFSTVFRAREDEFSRWVAVKIFHDLDERASVHFDRERSLLGRSSDHPNVITPLRSGVTNDGRPYLVMQYMPGGSLQDVINRGETVPWRDAIALIRPIAEALGQSHEAGILHKDVKPANILLARNGIPSLTDFGIASVRGSTATQTAFTFSHTPPETFADGRDVRDERSDLYSLASTLYTIVAGRIPFAADGDDDGEAKASRMALLQRIVTHPVPPLELDPALDRFLTWALAKDPADRPQNAREFIDGLDRVATGIAPRPETQEPAAAPYSAATQEPVVAAQLPLAAQVPDPGPARFGQPPLDAARPRPGRSWWTVALGWTAAAAVVAGLGAAIWVTLLRGSGDGPSPAAGGPGTASSIESSAGPSAASTMGPSAGRPPALPRQVQAAILLFQDPDSDVRTLVAEGVALPATGITDDHFTFRNCESQLVGLQAAFGGPDLPKLRDEIAGWPAGSPAGYVDPAGTDRGFQERLEAYVGQTEEGYRLCLDRFDISPVGARVLGGWASMQSFLCVTGVAAEVVVADGTSETCPAADEHELCARILAPLLDDFFLAFPERRPDPAAACQAAGEDDQAQLDTLSGPP